MAFDNDYDRQVSLEQDSAKEAINAYKAALLKARQKGSNLESFAPEMWLLKKSLKPLADAIEVFVKEKKKGTNRLRPVRVFLSHLNLLEVSFLTVRYILNKTVELTPIQSVAIGLARDLKFHADFETLKKDQPKLIKAIKARTNLDSLVHRVRVYKANMRRFEIKGMTEDELLSLGLCVIDLLISSSGIIKAVDYTKRGKSFKGLVLADEVLSWLNKQHGRCELSHVINPPMVVPPRVWTDNENGGYLTNFASGRQRLVKTRHTEVQSWLAKPEAVYSAVNALQSTPWKINAKVAQVLEEVTNLGGGFSGIPALDSQERELLQKPWGDSKAEYEQFKATNPEDVRSYCIKAKGLHDAWARETSKRSAFFMQLQFARKYGKESQIYFPWFLDWRGRMYPTVSFVNPQSDDVGKGLLEFSVGKQLTKSGIYWLYVHTANVAGVDKVPFDDRVKLVEENMEVILAVAQDPLSNRFWVDVDSPFKFLACCFELERLHKEGLSSFVTHLPVAMDGSCNGLQHYSALLRDDIAGAAVNLIPQDKPGDIYADVAKVVSELVDSSTDEEAVWWRGQVTRSVVKRNVMTLVYGVTSYGMGDQLHEVVKELGMDCGGMELKAATWLATRVYEGIGSVASSAKTGMAWLQECARIVAKTNEPLSWTTPSGFKVWHGYWETKRKVIKTVFGGCTMKLSLKEDTGTISSRSQANGIAPNFIHSLDASHCVLTINKAQERGLTDFAMIHDSYGCHASDVETLNATLREAFVDMYSGDVLMDFKKEVEQNSSVILPDLPKKGTLNIEGVLQSRYFFA
jgi:DNA-directed RNA polymerase